LSLAAGGFEMEAAVGALLESKLSRGDSAPGPTLPEYQSLRISDVFPRSNGTRMASRRIPNDATPVGPPRQMDRDS
jgi:hypothetical protein